jgi:hypothetical protein
MGISLKENFIKLISLLLFLCMSGCSNPIVIESKFVKYSEAKKIRAYVLENKPDLYAAEERKFFIFEECEEEAAPNKCDFVLSVSARNWGCTTWFDVKRTDDGEFELNEQGTLCK